MLSVSCKATGLLLLLLTHNGKEGTKTQLNDIIIIEWTAAVHSTLSSVFFQKKTNKHAHLFHDTQRHKRKEKKRIKQDTLV